MQKEEAIRHAIQAEMAELARMLVELALLYGLPKHHLTEIISDEYNLQRDNRRSPQ
jgi:hypothetical protein